MKPPPPKFKTLDRYGRTLVYAQNLKIDGRPALFMSGNAQAQTFTVMQPGGTFATFKAEPYGVTFQAEQPE